MATYADMVTELENKIYAAIQSGQAMISTVTQGDGTIIQYMSLPQAVTALRELKKLAQENGPITENNYRPIVISSGPSRVL